LRLHAQLLAANQGSVHPGLPAIDAYRHFPSDGGAAHSSVLVAIVVEGVTSTLSSAPHGYGRSTIGAERICAPSRHPAAAQALAFVRNMTAMMPPLMRGSRAKLSTTVIPHQISAWAQVGISSSRQVAM
jgi:hypothetical protein